MEKIMKKISNIFSFEKEQEEKDSKRKIYFLMNLGFLIIFSILLSLGTNFSPINRNIINHDCGIFSYIAFAMHNGRALYREAWENKGPLLYIIYYIGQAINGKYGVYILETISIFISTIFGYKTIKLITEKKRICNLRNNIYI